MAIERGEFVDLSDLLGEQLTMAGKSTKSTRATQSRCITSLDTVLDAWSLYATVLAAAKPRLAPEVSEFHHSNQLEVPNLCMAPVQSA